MGVQVSSIDVRLSDVHIFHISKLYESISFPEAKEESLETDKHEEVYDIRIHIVIDFIIFFYVLFYNSQL